MAGREDAVLVAARDKHQRAVDRHDLVEEHRDVHRPRLGHAVIARPGAVILVPLPDIAVERRLGVDLELMHVELLAEQLLYRLDEPRMRAEQAETLIVGMRGKGGARRAGFFLPDFLAARPVDRLRIAAQGRDLLVGKAFRQKEIALFVKSRELRGGQLHRDLWGVDRSVAA